MKSVSIGDFIIDKNRPVFIIAEAGVNHNGDIEIGKKLIEAAKAAGADAVKFQTFKAENLNTETAPKSTYHIETTGKEGSWFDLLKTQEMDRRAHEIYMKHCADCGIMFLSTPYDEESADLLDDLDIPAFKVASTDANNIPFLSYLARKGRPIILSTAMCTLEEVKASVDVIRKEGCDDLVLLHCTANYPARIEDLNLRAMATLRNECNLFVGYSDHACGYINPVAAVALGAAVYEKHFTLDKTLPGPDHRSSADPEELKKLVRDIRQTELALGKAEKCPTRSEEENRLKLRKSVVAKVDIEAGTVITRAMLAAKRPGTGLPPACMNDLVGKKAKVRFVKDECVKLENFE